MSNRETINIIEEFVEVIKKPKKSKGKLYTGVDLGTSNVVLAVLDESGKAIAGMTKKASVVRDGLVVDYIGAVDAVVELKEKLEQKLGVDLIYAAAAIPSGTQSTDHGAVKNVVESAGFILNCMTDESSAANNILNLTDGAIVDIGGGTTGISIIQQGEVIKTFDEPTGGTHFTLVVAGSKGIDYDSADDYKTKAGNQDELMPVVRPVINKISTIIEGAIAGYDVKEIHLVGGSSAFKNIEEVVESNLGISTFKSTHPRFVTPIGIALESVKAGVKNE